MSDLPDFPAGFDNSSNDPFREKSASYVILVMIFFLICIIVYLTVRNRPAPKPVTKMATAAPVTVTTGSPPAVATIPLAQQGPTYPAAAPEPSPYNSYTGQEPRWAEYTPGANYNLQYRQPINATKVSLIEIKTPEMFTDVVIKNKKDAICAFTSKGCGHCMSMKPEFEKAAAQAMIPFLMIERSVAEPAGFLEKYKIEGFPTIIRFSNGLPVAYFREARTADNLLKFAK